MAKKILFDLLSAQPNGNSKFHGGGEYIKTVLQKLINDYSDFIKIYVFYDKSKFLDDWLTKLIVSKNIVSYNATHISDVSNILRCEKFDIFYSGLPYCYTMDMFPYSIRKVGTFHGLRPIECSSDKYQFVYIEGNCIKNKIKRFIYSYSWSRKIWSERLRRNYKKFYSESLNCFDRCIVVSNHTKYAVENYYPDVKGKTEVCYSPVKEAGNISTSVGINKRYILLISADRWLKNSYRALCALDDMYERNLLSDIDVVLVGLRNTSFTKKLKNREKFHVKDYVEAEELEVLYKKCSIFLYPTLNEGFGYPPLEAMKYGRTCIVSAVCSLPEICGEAVYYINPYDLGEMQTRILNALENPISEEIIFQHRQKILKRQELDLNKLCKIIIGT